MLNASMDGMAEEEKNNDGKQYIGADVQWNFSNHNLVKTKNHVLN